MRSLEEEIREGRFREDLYFRVNTVAIHLPPLRERREDIPLLSESFLREFAADRRREIGGFTEDAMELLEMYSWPGNVRELRNVVERAVLFCRGPMVTVDELPPNLRGGAPETSMGETAPVVAMHDAVERAVDNFYVLTRLKILGTVNIINLLQNLAIRLLSNFPQIRPAS